MPKNPKKRNFTHAQVNTKEQNDGIRVSSKALAKGNGVPDDDIEHLFIYHPENEKMKDKNENILKTLEKHAKHSKDAVELHDEYNIAHAESLAF